VIRPFASFTVKKCTVYDITSPVVQQVCIRKCASGRAEETANARKLRQLRRSESNLFLHHSWSVNQGGGGSTKAYDRLQRAQEVSGEAGQGGGSQESHLCV
jgi:hypothetical protein